MGVAQLHPGREHQPQPLVLRRIVRHRFDDALQVAIARIRETLDLYRCPLAGPHETDVLVQHRGFDFQHVLIGHDRHQRLRRSHYASDGMHGQLLHGAINRRPQLHRSVALPSLVHLRCVLADLFPRLAQPVVGPLSGFGRQHAKFLLRPGDGRLRLGQAGLLRGHCALQFDHFLLAGQIIVAADVLASQQALQVGYPLPGDLQALLERRDLRAHRLRPRPLLPDDRLQALLLRLERGELAAGQLPGGLQPVFRQAGIAARSCRQNSRIQRIGHRGMAQFGQPGGGQRLIGLRVVRAGGGGIQFHQHVALLHLLPVAYADAPDHRRLDGLDDLGPAAGHGLARGHGDDVQLADDGPQQGHAEERDDGAHRPVRQGRCGRLDQFQA